MSPAAPFSFSLVTNPPDHTVMHALKWLGTSKPGPQMSVQQIKDGLAYSHPIWDDISAKRLKLLQKKMEQEGFVVEGHGVEKQDDRNDGKQEEKLKEGGGKTKRKGKKFGGNQPFDEFIGESDIDHGKMYLLSNEVAQLSSEVDGDVSKLPHWLRVAHTGSTRPGFDTFMVKGMMFMTCQTNIVGRGGEGGRDNFEDILKDLEDSSDDGDESEDEEEEKESEGKEAGDGIVGDTDIDVESLKSDMQKSSLHEVD